MNLVLEQETHHGFCAEITQDCTSDCLKTILGETAAGSQQNKPDENIAQSRHEYMRISTENAALLIKITQLQLTN